MKLALLRGINVGGKNLVRMADLREAFTDLGAEDVQTYIASGNVLFTGALKPADLEPELSARFQTELKVVVLTAKQLQAVVDGAPEDVGDPDHKWDVVFCRKPLTAAHLFSLFDPREGIDRVWQGPGVVYVARLAARASGSRFTKITQVPEYKNTTIRTWRTVEKLSRLSAPDPPSTARAARA